LLAAASSCGDVQFVPSPYTPQFVELDYSPQEHLTVVRWRVDASAPVAQTHFELLDSDGSYSPIDFSQSAYPGGVIPCRNDTGACAQYVVRGNYTVVAGDRPIRAVHDVYGVFPGDRAAMKEVSPSLSFKSFFHTGNQMVTVNITDAVGDAGPYSFPRSFERAMWPTTGLCVADAVPDDVSFSPLDDKTSGFDAPQPLSDLGIYCVATRPVPNDQGDAAMAQARVATLPETVTEKKDFAPPIERSPIIYQIFLDLEIPVPDRCADVIQKIESLTQRYMMGGGAPVYKLPTVNLSTDPANPCAQTNERQIDSTQLGIAVKQLITTLPGEHQQYHMMYFNNLDAPLPDGLRTSIQDLIDGLATSPPGYQVSDYAWLFAPPTAGASSMPEPRWWAYWLWQTPDMSFELQLADYSNKKLPYTSQVHDANEPVPLLSASEAAAYEGHFIKICDSFPPVLPVSQLPTQHSIFTPSWTITAADPPAYLVTLDNQEVVDATKFVPQMATVTYQICTRYCDDHPYLNRSDGGELSWNDTAACAGEIK
jgi:hypothetical protein